MAIKNCAESSEASIWTDEERLIRCLFSNRDNISNCDYGTSDHNNNNYFSLSRQTIRYFQKIVSPDLLEKFKRSINNHLKNKTIADKSLVKKSEYADYVYLRAIFDLWNNEPDKIKMALAIWLTTQGNQ
jgi:hypothetical protein